MFDEINGLPAHPLVIHAAVVLIPLLCVVALVYAFVPRARQAIWWAAVTLAVAGPLAAFLATNSGESLAETRYPGQLPEATHEHEEFGEATLYVSLGLGLATLLLVYLSRTRAGAARPMRPWVSAAMTAVVAVLVVTTAYYVIRTGDSGAQSVWSS